MKKYRRYGCKAFSACAFSMLLLFGMVSYAAAAPVQSSGSHLRSASHQALAILPYNQGYANGCYEAQQGQPMVALTFYVGIANYQYLAGLHAGYNACGAKTTTDYYQTGYNAGMADGKSECSQSLPMTVRQTNDEHNFNSGYTNGLSDGFHQAGCS